MSIFFIIISLCLLVLLRLPFVTKARLKRIADANSFRELAEFNSGPSFNGMIFMITKWTYNQFYPKEK